LCIFFEGGLYDLAYDLSSFPPEEFRFFNTIPFPETALLLLLF